MPAEAAPTGLGEREANRARRAAIQMPTLSRLVRSALEKLTASTGRVVDDLTVALIAGQALKTFPDRDWTAYGGADELDEFVVIALADLSHTMSFANTEDFFSFHAELKQLARRQGEGANWGTFDDLERKLEAIIETAATLSPRETRKQYSPS